MDPAQAAESFRFERIRAWLNPYEYETGKAMQALERTGFKTLALAGGVAANHGLRHTLEEECHKRGVRLCRPDPVLCTDNGAMIGCRAYYMAQAGVYAPLTLNADPRLPFLAEQFELKK